MGRALSRPNARPAFATPGASGTNIVATQWGNFDTSHACFRRTHHSPKLGTGPGQFTTNLRLSKTFGFGKKPEGSVADRAGPTWAAEEDMAAGLAVAD